MPLLFITGTDTSVGKTVLTALLLCHLRHTGRRAVALKPFCSGSRADGRLLYSLKAPDENSEIKNPLTLDDINPFHFPEPLAPLVAARKHRRRITLSDVQHYISRVARSLTNPLIHQSTHSNPTLLIEGAGGLLAPLGESFNLLDLITQLALIRTSSQHPASSIQHPASSIRNPASSIRNPASSIRNPASHPPSSTIHPPPSPSTPPTVLIVAPNRLGTINHCLLTVRALQVAGVQELSVVLMGQLKPNPSAVSNPKILSELLAPVPVHTIPFLGHCRTRAALESSAVRLRRILARLVS